MTTLTLRTLQTRVQKSAKELDNSQKDWHKKINLSTFDMQFSSKCIAGQLGLPDSYDEKRAFFLPMYVPLTHKGKSLGTPGLWNDQLKPYKVLTRLWKHQIKQRLKQDKKREIVDKIMELLNF